MKVGIVGSSGGSVAKEVVTALNSRIDFSIVSDRRCGLEALATSFDLPFLRVVEPDNYRFSAKAAEFFDAQGGADVVLLFYSRLVTEELFERHLTFNVHPSKLPEYRGFRAVERAYADRVCQLGATLHIVDETVDDGPIVAQVVNRLVAGTSLQNMLRLSFAQKIHLCLHLMSLLLLTEGEVRDRDFFRSRTAINPSIEDSVLSAYFGALLDREELHYMS